MPSETDFLNDALGQIGASRITGIDDGTENANHCKTFWPPLRRALLRSHHWNFAEARAALAQDAVAPAFEFNFAYTLPANLLKVKEYNGTDLDTTGSDLTWIASLFKIEGRKLLTNDATVLIVYIQDVSDPNIWDPLFYQAAASRLASKLADAIPKDNKLAQNKRTESDLVDMPTALSVDGQEGTVSPFISDELTRGR